MLDFGIFSSYWEDVRITISDWCWKDLIEIVIMGAMSLSLGLGILQSLYAFHARPIGLDALCTCRYEFRDNRATNYPSRSLSPH